MGRTLTGQWWWVDPVRGPVAVAGVQGAVQSLGDAPVVDALREWGFNLLAPPVAEGFCDRAVPHLHHLALRQAGDLAIRSVGVLLPDVFDPRWPAAVEQVANAVRRTASLAGYVTDDELRWGAVAAPDAPLTRPGLLQACLSLDPAFAAYHAAWEFVFATRGGELAQLARDWGLALANKESVRQMTRDEIALDSPGYRVDLERFQREFALRYHRIVAESVRRVDPARLLLSAPLNEVTPLVVRDSAAAHFDVLLVRQPGLGQGRAAELLWEYNWSALAALPADADEPWGVSLLERVVVKGREELSQLLMDPHIVGYVWSHHVAGDTIEANPVSPGLLDGSGRINPLTVAPLTALNRAATAIRASNAPG